MAERDLTGRMLGEFVLREQIGEGGYGAVYRCTQPGLKRDAVIKVLHDRRRGNGIAQERFLREARLASRLDHPYAAHIYASGVEPEDGLLWIAMELVHGTPLDRWLATRGPMPLDQLVPFFERIAQVVQAAHDCGIVHRDLKPSNMMVIERDGLLLPKLLDFGIAKSEADLDTAVPVAWPEGSLGENQNAGGASGVDGVITARIRMSPTRIQRTRTNPDLAMAALPNRAELTRPGAGLGSSAYMSPEQWSNASAVGPASDVYSLGVVAYEALTGRPPFAGTSTDELFLSHLEESVPHLGGEFSPELDRVLQRALAKAPEARHGSVRELAAELGAALRATEREQIRVSALQWKDRANAPGLLWGADVLADFERWTRRNAPGALNALECSFVAASQRRARRGAWLRRLAIGLGVLAVLGIALMQVRLAREQTRSAERLADATITQSELEQGRAALLHGEPDAPAHLAEAYKRDPAPSTAFMLARALQPRLAELAKFSSTSGRMWSAAFSPDGKQIVTTDEKNAQVWDGQTYQRLFVLPHGDTVYQAIYSADGAKIVTTGGDGVVRIWDATHGTLVRELKRGGAKLRYFAVAMSPDGELVAAIDNKGDRADVWETTTGTLVTEARNEGSAYPVVAFSGDGRWLAMTGGDDVRVFDVRARRFTTTIHGPRIRNLAFDPTGPRLLTGAATGDIAIWAIPNGDRIRHLREIGEPVNAVAFSPNGELVVAASQATATQIWRAASGELQSQLSPRRGKVLALEFDPTSKLVLTAGTDETVVIADVTLGTQVAVLELPHGVVRAAHFDPGSRRVVGTSSDGTVRVWDATAPYRRWESSAVSDDCGVITTPDPDGRFLAIGCKDRPTRVWDTSRSQLLAELPTVSQVDGNFTSSFPAVSVAGDRAAIARANTVKIYELPGGKLLRTITHPSAVNAVAFAKVGRDVVSGAVDGSLLITRDSGAQLALPLATGGIDAVAFLADGRVVTTDERRRMRFYGVDGSILADLELPMRVMSLRDNETRLVTVPIIPSSASAAPSALVDVEHYQVIAYLEGHVGRVFSARWVAGGRILTSGADGTARLWDGATGRLRQIYRGSAGFLADAVLTSDGLVVAGGMDGLLRFWDQDSGRQLWTLSAHRSQVSGIHVEGGEIVTRGFSGEVARWALPSAATILDACNKHESCGIVPQ